MTPDSYPDLHSGPVTVYSAALVIPVTAPAIVEGAVAVSGRHILHVGTREWVLDSLDRQGRDVTETYWPGVLTPGLINAHSHLQYTGMAEVGQGRYKGVDDWDEAFMPSYTQPHDWAADAAEGARRLIRSGQTSVADIVTDPEAISVLHDAGLHGITYWEVMGWENERWQAEGRGRVVNELARVPSPPGVGLSPHAPYSLDTQPLLDIPDIVRQRGLRIHIHLAESELEGSDLHPSTVHWPSLDARSFRSLREEHGLGISSTEFVDQLGLLGPDCHVAHGIYVTARDRALLRARGTSVALCPRSNAVIGLDAPPVADYLREGNPLAVGTDSLSSSPSLDLLADVAELYRLARAQGYHDEDLHSRLLSLATLGGAQAMGIGAGPDRVGYLAVGALADLAFFDVPVQTSAPQDSLAHLVEAGEGTARATVIEGRLRWAAQGWPGGAVELPGEDESTSTGRASTGAPTSGTAESSTAAS